MLKKKKEKKKNLKQFKSKTAIIDNNILMDFYELGRLDVLFATFCRAEIPDKLYEKEVPHYIKEKIDGYDLVCVSVDTAEGYEMYATLLNHGGYSGLSAYDRMMIVVAKQGKCMCTSNDGLLRKACDEFGVECTGTLGIIASAFQNDIITKGEFDNLILQLISDETSCYITRKTVQSFLDEIKI